MADAGYSKDYLLARKLCANGKYIQHDKDDSSLVTKLKNYINDYVYIRCYREKFPAIWEFYKKKYRYYDGWQNRCDNIIIEMNQLRQRNWYWKELKE